MLKRLSVIAVLAATFVAGFLARGVMPGEPVAHAQAPASARVFEMRTYVVPEASLAALNTRFRDHTMRLFQKHGISNVAYFTPTDEAKKKTTLVYLIAHPSQEKAAENWKAFGSDPDWQAAAKASGVPRPQIESVFLTATDYSPLK
jgi:hypothetical protein